MLLIANISNKLIISLIFAVFTIFIGVLDWFTGYEFSLSPFYLIPIALLALYKNVAVYQLIINSIISALVGFAADVLAKHHYSHAFFLYWDAFVRFTISSIISLLVYSLKKEHFKLIQSNEQLKKLNEEKNIFLGIAAHDLRNPISIIKSFSEILIINKKHQEKEIENYIKIIHDASDQSLNLIMNLLDVSKIEAGAINIKFQPLNYIAFIENNITINQYIADKKSSKLSMEAESDHIVVDFDPAYMEEVLNNLISNAIKYSHNNCEIKIRISEKNLQVLTEVIDNGVGIPESELKNLFNPFQKTTAVPTSGEPSTGLGLAIVKKIVTLHNGEVGIRSVLREGTNVFFSLPKKQNQIQV